MAIIKCIECGKQVTDTINVCIHCQNNPFGVRCYLCGQSLAESKASRKSSNYYHAECMDQFLFQFASVNTNWLKCPECGKTIPDPPNTEQLLETIDGYNYSHAFMPCPFCGFTKVLGYKGECVKCHLPVYGSLHRYSELQTKAGPAPKDPWIPSYRYHDPLCTPYEIDADVRGMDRRLVLIEGAMIDRVLLQIRGRSFEKRAGCMSKIFALMLLLVALILRMVH
jgi:hypothetical protein